MFGFFYSIISKFSDFSLITFIKLGNNVGANSFTGSYNIASFCCASEIKGRVSFNFEKTNKTMLKIKADFREPKHRLQFY